MNKEVWAKAFKGFVSGAGVSLTAFLSTNGCQVSDLNAFLYSAGLGALSGGFHALWNLYVTQPRRDEI